MDDVKHVILRFQDQKLLDEQSVENTTARVIDESEKVSVETRMYYSSALIDWLIDWLRSMFREER